MLTPTTLTHDKFAHKNKKDSESKSSDDDKVEAEWKTFFEDSTSDQAASASVEDKLNTILHGVKKKPY